MSKRGRVILITIWLLFLLTFGLTIALVIRKATGRPQIGNPYFYVVGPLSFLLAAIGLFGTSRVIGRRAESRHTDNVALLWILRALSIGFAVWLLGMSIVFLISLIEGPKFDRGWFRLTGSAAATVTYLYAWIKSPRFSWWGIVPCCGFIFLIVQSGLRLLRF